MKHIKLFERFNTDDDVAGALNEAITGTAESFLDNEGDELNKALGVATLPKHYEFATPLSKKGGVIGDEIDLIVDAMDSPRDKGDVERVRGWISGAGWSGSFGGKFKEFGPLKERVFQGADKKWYPAVESLRASYNKDESFETLGSITKDADLKDVRSSLISAYQYWIDCVNNKIK
jgi:hypothetical protein